MIIALFFFNEIIAAAQPPKEERDLYAIYECTRPVKCFSRVNMGPYSCPEHCFTVCGELNGDQFDSRGFFGDSGPQREPQIHCGERRCHIVQTFKTRAELDKAWLNVLSVYNKYTAQDYKLGSRNCCSVAVEALQEVKGPGRSLYVEAVNSGIGTKCSIDS